MEKNASLNIPRVIALAAVLAGAVASLDLTLRAGHNNNSVLLVILFSCWVLSPFAGLLVAIALFKRRPSISRLMLYILALVISIGSLLCYGGTFSIPGAKPAAVFLFVPLVSWVLVVIVIMAAPKASREDKNI